MEWQAPAVVLSARPHGEGGAVIALLTEEHGRHAGLAKGGGSRAQVAIWQPGNLVEAHWMARLADQLGALTGELLHPGAALVMDDPLGLAVLNAACAVADGALPERIPHPQSFSGLVRLLVALPQGPEVSLPAYLRWEMGLLAELGYGLDLTRCAATGSNQHLVWVSPRSGRAVSAEAGEPWRDRMLALPRFLLDPTGKDPSGPADWLAGLRLTGHFLGRDAYGHQHRPVPVARDLLVDRVAGLVGDGPAEDLQA
jgi:DNA repair protein RecO (recombination protein O)